LERSDNVADPGHAFAMLKRGYTGCELSARLQRGQPDRDNPAGPDGKHG
jgi:hypothetical protein